MTMENIEPDAPPVVHEHAQIRFIDRAKGLRDAIAVLALAAVLVFAWQGHDDAHSAEVAASNAASAASALKLRRFRVLSGFVGKGQVHRDGSKWLS
jgi:hypothetical protein